MKRLLTCMAVALALLAIPGPAPASQTTGIWIINTTNNCLWATVYTAGKIVGAPGFPGWVPAKEKRIYQIQWKGVGQSFRVRAEVLSTTHCAAQNAQHPLVADVDTNVQGSLAYQVRLMGGGNHFYFERF